MERDSAARQDEMEETNTVIENDEGEQSEAFASEFSSNNKRGNETPREMAQMEMSSGRAQW